MQENPKQNLSVQEIIQKIKMEVAKREKKDSSVKKEEIRTALDYEDIIKKEDTTFLQKERYEYSDFTRYKDVVFIKNLYKGLLKREADSSGLQNYLKLLRSGKKSKDEIVTLIRYSQEGRSKNVELLGAKKRNMLMYFFNLPFIGYIFKLFIAIGSLPKLLQKINYLESRVDEESLKSYENDRLLEKAILMQAKTFSFEIEEKVKNLEKKINISIAEVENKIQQKNGLEAHIQTIENIKSYMQISLTKLQNLIDEAKKRLPDELLREEEILKLTQEEKHLLDSFYVEFEDRFRGTREDIKERLAVYIPYIEALDQKQEKLEVLDVGCGRGEWIELLSSHNYRAKGIDLNSIMVAQSQALGLDVMEADVISYLQSLKDDSLSVITGFHIIEHLPFEVLMKMLHEVYRVLHKGGMVIFETPNPENLLIGACNFYTDPTHINPLVPKTVSFLLESKGFQKNEILRLHKYSDYYAVDKNTPFINEHFYNEMDYAVIGYK